MASLLFSFFRARNGININSIVQAFGEKDLGGRWREEYFEGEGVVRIAFTEHFEHESRSLILPFVSISHLETCARFLGARLSFSSARLDSSGDKVK